MSGEKKTNQPQGKLWQALLVLAITVGVMAPSIIYDDYIHGPMFVGIIVASIMALIIGFKWEDIEKMMMDGIYKALQSIMILAVVGILVGVWLNAGVIQSMIVYGLKLLHPSIFLFAVLLICSITSLATGSSWGTAGTMGIAFVGMAYGMGISPAMTAGAALSGAYFGDKMSPLSDTTNLAPAMAGTDVMTHVKFMLLPTGITYAICAIAFLIMGFTGAGGAADMSSAQALGDALRNSYVISPLLLLPPLVVIVSIAMKVPALPGITLGIISAAILGIIMQPDCTFYSVMNFAYYEYAPAASTGIQEVDDLLARGGVESMLYSISITILAMMFGGIMEGTGMMGSIVDQIKKLAKGPGGLVAVTEATCLFSNIALPEQYISIIIPGRMYADEYAKMGLHPACCSNALESSGTVTSALVPWNTCGVYMSGTLNMPVWGAGGYAPFAIFNWLMPLVNIAMAYMGLTVADMNNVRLAKKKKNKA